MLGTMVAGGIPIEVRQQWPTLPKLGIAVVFPFALHFILLFGGELFTGNCMILTIGLWNRTIPLSGALINLLIVWTGNFLGCLICAVLFSYETELFSQEPYLSFVRDLAYTKPKNTAGSISSYAPFLPTHSSVWQSCSVSLQETALVKSWLSGSQ